MLAVFLGKQTQSLIPTRLTSDFNGNGNLCPRAALKQCSLLQLIALLNGKMLPPFVEPRPSQNTGSVSGTAVSVCVLFLFVAQLCLRGA